jgi:hypothetical protein
MLESLDGQFSFIFLSIDHRTCAKSVSTDDNPFL